MAAMAMSDSSTSSKMSSRAAKFYYILYTNFFKLSFSSLSAAPE